MERQELVSLVTKAQAGNAEALEALFAAFYEDVYDFAKRTVRDEDIACDITQETFLEIIHTIGNLKEPVAFVTWMKKIAYHQCTRYFKKKKDVLVEEDEDGNTIFDNLADESEDAIPAEVYEKAEFRQTIMGMIDTLSEPQRAAVYLHYYDQLPVAQIAQIQDVSEGTVKSRLNYARKTLKVTVEDYEKKHDVKLHSFSFLPLFLLLFLGKEKMPADKLARTRKAVELAAKQAAPAVATGSGFAAKLNAMPFTTKAIAIVAAAAIAVGGVALAVSPKKETPSVPAPTQQVQQVQQEESVAPESTETVETEPVQTVVGPNWLEVEQMKEYIGNATAVYFTAQPIPADAETQDISMVGDGSVLLWWDDTEAYITTADGSPIILPAESGHMFQLVEGDYENGRVVENTNLTKVVFENVDTSHVEDMSYLFDGCVNLQEVDMSSWDTSNVYSIQMMFHMCRNLKTVDVSSWDTSNVLFMHSAFGECESLETLDVSGWNTANVRDFSWMFGECRNLTVLDMSGWDTSSAERMDWMFFNCNSVEVLDVSGFDTSRVTDMLNMFAGCKQVKQLDVSGFDTSRVTDMFGMFDGCESLTQLDVSGFNTSNVTDMGGMFAFTRLETVDVSGFDTAKVTSMYSMFGYNPNLRYVDVSGFDTSSVTNMEGMFVDCTSLQSVDVSSWDTSNVENFSMMFMDCTGLNAVDVSGFDTSNVTDTMFMFDGCTNLIYVDVSAWDTSSLIDADGMFRNCPNLQTPDTSGWTMPTNTAYEDMF